MNVQLVIIEFKISTAVAVKQALEKTRHFRVYPFADAFAALDFMRANPTDIALVSMHMPEYPGKELIQAVRSHRPGALVIAVTADSMVAASAVTLGAAGLLDTDYTARSVLETIEQIAPQFAPPQSPTSSGKPVEPPSPPIQEPPTTEESSKVFEKLAAEEPPLPGLRQGGTITNYMMRVSDAELNNLLSSLNEIMGDDNSPPASLPNDEQETLPKRDDDTPAQFIIEDALDQTIPLDNLPFEAYLHRLRHQHDNDERYVREPDFLDHTDFEPPALNQTTEPSRAEQERINADTDKPETVTLANVSPFVDAQDEEDTHWQTPAAPGQEPEPDEPELDQPDESALPRPEDAPAQTSAWDWGKPEPAPPPQPAPNDPRLAQMAVSLTQASLESTAVATLLTRGEEIIAYDGEMAESDVQFIVDAVAGIEKDIVPQQARVRFLTLESTSLDYLIYSRRTNEAMILSMVFAGNTSMTEIRHQAQRLVDALESVPALPPETLMTTPEAAISAEDAPSKGGLRLESPPASVDVGPLTRYTFLWLPEDPTFNIGHATAEAINSGLRVQLIERGWHVESLEVEDDYVYLVAGVPGDEPPQSIVQNLKKRAAHIAAIQNPKLHPETLWANSYFILSPGRELNVQEIQQYINFYRI
jgi:DNA-binding NarL/FixJ family response regulator/REP element-mobilizing transposase RayT